MYGSLKISNIFCEGTSYIKGRGVAAKGGTRDLDFPGKKSPWEKSFL